MQKRLCILIEHYTLLSRIQCKNNVILKNSTNDVTLYTAIRLW
jgi:hypothetical protein